MIPYYEELTPEEQSELTEIIRLLYRQTFILERKYDRRTGRYLYNKEYRVCSNHMEFIRDYLKIAGIEIRENSQMGVIYMQGEGQVGDKLPRLATLYLLILKLIYDEQMASVSNSVHIITLLSEMHERLGNILGLLSRKPAPTEIRRALALLKKYQIIEPLDLLEGVDPQCRLMIYPTINVVLFGEDARSLLSSFAENHSAEEATGANQTGMQLEVQTEMQAQMQTEMQLEMQAEGGDGDDADEDTL